MVDTTNQNVVDENAAEEQILMQAEKRSVLRMVKWLLYFVYVFLAYFILLKLAPILMPLIVAAAIAYLLDPLVDKGVARGMSRPMMVGLLIVGFLVTFVGLIVLFLPLMVEELAAIIKDMPQSAEGLRAWVLQKTGIEIPASWDAYLSVEALKSGLQSWSTELGDIVSQAIGGAFSAIGTMIHMLMIPVFTYYLLTDWDLVVKRVDAMVPHRHRRGTREVCKEIDSVVSNWIRGQFIVTAILTVLYAIAFKVLDVPMGIVVGAIVGAITIIPFLGTIVGCIFTIGLLLIDWQGPGQLLSVGAVFLVLHLLEAGVLTPKMLGHRVGLGEVGALFSIIAGGHLLGFVGMLLAIPLAASVAVLARRAYRYYESTDFYQEKSIIETPGA